jgi:hypothetical protein
LSSFKRHHLSIYIYVYTVFPLYCCYNEIWIQGTRDKETNEKVAAIIQA